MDAGPTAAVGAGGARKRKGYGEAGAAGADTTTKKPRSLCPGICPHQRIRSRCKESEILQYGTL